MLWVIIGLITIVTLAILAGVLVVMHGHKPKGPNDPLADIHVEMTPQLAAELENNLKAAFQKQIDEVTSKFAADLSNSSKSISDKLGGLSVQVVDEEVAKFQQTLETLRSTSGTASDQLKQASDQVLAEIRTATEQLGAQLQQASQGSFAEVSKASADTLASVSQTVASTMQQLQDASTGTLAKISAEAEAQSQQLHASMAAEVAAEQRLLIGKFDAKMADIITSYLADALGGGIDLGTQRDYVMQTLEAHREDIKRDLMGEA